MIYKDEYKHKGLRKSLVNTLRAKGITNEKVLYAMGQVPRHFFFDDALLHHAYEDKAFPIGNGQTISQPYTVARQTELLELFEGAKVLEIGTGSGYQASILSELNCKVFSVEVVEPLYKKTKMHLNNLGYQVRCYLSDGSLGFKKWAPYDRILMTAGSPDIPDSLFDQLSEEGILVAPVGDRETQKMLRFKKIGGEIHEESHGDFAFVPLTGQKGWKK